MNVGNGWQSIDVKRLGDSPRYALTLPGRTVDVLAREAKDGLEVVIDGVAYAVGTSRPRKGRGRPDEDDDGHFEDGKWTLLSPITGSVVEVRVAAGDEVEAGAILMIVEAMKMQNELRSRVAGTVTALKVEKGQRVDTGTVLAEVSAPP